MQGYFILIALSLHSFFEGVAFGIMDETSEAVNIMIAILAHKWSDTLSIGICLVKNDIPRYIAIRYIVFLSLTTPLGFVLGVNLSELDDIIKGIAYSVSAGTFLYISCIEIIHTEFSNNRFINFKFGSLICGFLVITGLVILERELVEH